MSLISPIGRSGTRPSSPSRFAKNRAVALILSLALLMLISLLAVAFLSAVDICGMIKESCVTALRAELMAKTGQATARLWLKQQGGTMAQVVFYPAYEERLSSFRGHAGDSSVKVSVMVPESLDKPVPVQIALRTAQAERTRNQGGSGKIAWRTSRWKRSGRRW